MTITRRTLSKAIALGASSCLVPEVFAQASPDNTGIPNPYRSVNVPTDRSNVIFFFDFGCPFCAKLHDPFISWSTTTPKAIKVSMLPVVNASDAAKLREQIIAARCYFAARQLATPDQLKLFVNAVYENIASGVPVNVQQGWIRAVKTAGIDMARFGNLISAKDHLTDIQSAGKQAIQYALEATPSVAIGGKYVVIPDNVGGDPAKFFTLVNGLTSRLLGA